MYLEIRLQHTGCEWCTDKLKCHKIGTNDKINRKQAINKVPFLFLELELDNVR